MQNQVIKSDNALKIVIILCACIFVIGASLFYWYEWRPINIKERCYAEAEFDQASLNQSDDILRNILINRYYEKCLKRFGIK